MKSGVQFCSIDRIYLIHLDAYFPLACISASIGKISVKVVPKELGYPLLSS